MADINDRGQIILVAAFALGVIFIALAVVVNTAIFTENLATRSESTDGSDALEYRHEVEQSVETVLESVNGYDLANSNPSYSDLETDLKNNITNVSSQAGYWQASNGRIISIEYLSKINGIQFESDASARNFTENGKDNATWVLAEDVSDTRNFRINITDDSNLSSDSSTAFNLTVNESSGGSDKWRMTVYDDGGDVTIRVKEGNGGTATCDTSETNPVIDVTRGMLAGEPCSALRFNDSTDLWYGSNVSKPYDIVFENSTNITGVYQGVINVTSLTGTVDGESGDAIYSTRIDYIYETSAVRYETVIRAAPGEPDS